MVLTKIVSQQNPSLEKQQWYGLWKVIFDQATNELTKKLLVERIRDGKIHHMWNGIEEKCI